MALSSPLYCDSCGTANRTQATFCFACGQPLHAYGGKKSNLDTGLLIHNHLLKVRYRVLGQIGKGGFGAVYKAMDLQFGNRLVAIKEMSQKGLTTQEQTEATNAFKREALLLAGLTHPNLPRIYEQFADMGRWYLVMDFIDGETLTAHLIKQPGGKLSIEKTLPIAIQLCMVLEYLHMRQPPIIFRDLKPANIMLTTNGHVFLIDFGIARHFKPGQAKDTAALGSSGYAAPEQYGKAQTTPRADIYGLGATLHQLLSGSDPADAPFHFTPLRLPAHPAHTRLEQLIMQMVEVDINKRPATIGVVRQELQNIAAVKVSALSQASPTLSFISGIPTGYQAPTTLPPMLPLQPRTTRPQPQAPQPLRNTRFICSRHSSRVTAVAWSPKGTHVASASYDKTVRLWDVGDGSNPITYRGHWDRVQAVTWSPDGKQLASAGDDGTVQIWDAATGRHVLTYREHSQAISALAWSPDGRRLASGSNDKLVQIWDVVTGLTLFTYRGHSSRVLTLAWSLDGRRLATGGEDKAIHVWTPSKDKSGFFTSFLFSSRGQFIYRGHAARVNALMWSPNGQRIASVSSDKTLQVWDSTTGKKFFIHRNTSSTINTVAWSFDGRRIATGANDKLVQVWDSITRHSVSTYAGHTGYVQALTWSPDGTLIASGGVDHTVQIWQP